MSYSIFLILGEPPTGERQLVEEKPTIEEAIEFLRQRAAAHGFTHFFAERDEPHNAADVFEGKPGTAIANIYAIEPKETQP